MNTLVDQPLPSLTEVASEQSAHSVTAFPLKISASPNRAANKNTNEVMEMLKDYEVGFQRHTLQGLECQVEGNTLHVGENTYRLNQAGNERLCDQVRIPFKFYNSLPFDLQTSLVQWQIDQGQFSDRRMHAGNAELVSRDGVFLTLRRSDLCYLPNHDAFQAVLDGLGEDVSSFQVHQLTLRDDCFAIQLVSPRDQFEVQPGDALQKGIEFKTHTLEGSAPQLFGTVLRLACLNGMTYRQCINQGGNNISRTRRLPLENEASLEQQKDQIRRLTAKAIQDLRNAPDNIRFLPPHISSRCGEVSVVLAAILGSEGGVVTEVA